MQDGSRENDVLFRHRGTLLILLTAPVVVAAFSGRPLEVWELATGGAFVLAGTLLRLIAVRHIGKRARVARAGAATLLCTGPYGHVRNPIYVANLSILGGAAVLSGLGPWAIAVAAFGLGIYHAVVSVEEVRLGELFGEGYKTYCGRVPRWLPRVTAATPVVDDPAPLWPWPQVLGREAPMVLGVVVLYAAIAWVRAPGPFVGPIVALIDRLAGIVALPRSVFIAALIVIGAAIEGLATYVKRRRHALYRAQRDAELAAQQANAPAAPADAGSANAVRQEIQAHD